MSSTYSSNLRVELIGSGDQAGTWGTTTDNNFNYIFDAAIAGAIDVTIAGTPQALTAIQGPTSSPALNQAVYATLKLISAPAAFTLYAPPAAKQYIVWNATSYTATIGNATALGGTTSTGGATITLAAGERALIWSDATNFYKLTVDLSVASGTLPIANGGTGQTTRQNAMDALAGAVTSGQYLRGNGTDVVMSAIQAADVPTLNQNTTGTAASSPKLLTTNFTIEESGGKLVIKYGATTIVSISSTGNIIAAGSLDAGGTP